MFCENCGSELDPGAKFCKQCGAPVIAAPSTHQANTIHSAAATSSPTHITDNHLAAIIRAKSKRRLYFSICLLVISILIFISQTNYISNILSGPRAIDPTVLENEILSGNIKDWNISLAIDPNSVYGTGWVLVTSQVNENTNQVESSSTSKEYFGTILGQHIIVLENEPGQTPSGNFHGILKPVPDDLRQGLINDLNSDPDTQGLNAEARLLPYMLSDDSVFSMDAFGWVLAGIILFVWGAILFLRRIRDLDDKKHYFYRTLRVAGYNNINEASTDFDVSAKAMNTKVGAYHLTTKFLFRESFFSFTIYPLSELYWIYKKVTSKRKSFSTKGASHYSAVLHFKPNKMVEVSGSETQINDYLLGLATLRPGIKVGYTK
jgi:hypothetical protein